MYKIILLSSILLTYGLSISAAQSKSTNSFQQIYESLLQRDDRIRSPPNPKDQLIVKQINESQSMKAYQKIMRKLTSFLPLKIAFSLLFENQYVIGLTDVPLARANPYASYLNERLALLKLLRFNMIVKEKNEKNETIKAELRKVLEDTERAIEKYN